MSREGRTQRLLDRETSWLHFNGRVLQEAEDAAVPLLERLFFCGIFSSNLDEYFRVRVASLRSLLRLGKGDADKLGINPYRLLYEIHHIVHDQQERYGTILSGIFEELQREGVRLADERSVDPAHRGFLRELFEQEVRPHLHPEMLEGPNGPPFLKNRAVYLVVELWPAKADQIDSWTPEYALVDVPASTSRFVSLPATEQGRTVMFVDDVIRYNLPSLFADHQVGRSFAVKLTRDAELNVEDEFEGDLVEAIRTSLKNRETGAPSRFLYDGQAPYVLVHRLQHVLGLSEEDLVLGARYHNLHDYMDFPRSARDDLSYPAWPALPHPTLDLPRPVFATIRQRDQVVHVPYHAFDGVVRFLEEAAEDPAVEEVWLTVYRVARDSAVLTALTRAAERGKRVNVFMEVQARFDEESNLHWAERLEAAGVRTFYSMPGIKVHAKIALVVRREHGRTVRYAYVGTGNFNEKTARVYADHGIFTRSEGVTKDVAAVFRYLAGESDQPQTEHLLVAPFTLRKRLSELVESERERAERGEPSGIVLKVNALEDRAMIEQLYAASAAGVPIEIIVRGICRLIPGVPGQSETIRARSILDRYLEHARLYLFHNGGEELMYLASADWMKRNLSRRVEVAVPVLDPEIRRQLRTLIDLQLADDTKARVIEATGENRYVESIPGGARIRSQEAFRAFVASLGG